MRSAILFLVLAILVSIAPAQQLNIGIDCYLAVYDTPSYAICDGFATTGCDLAIPSSHGAGYISLAVHGQPSTYFYYAINTTGLHYNWTSGCYGIWDMDLTGSYVGIYAFPSTCTTGYNGTCTAFIPIFGYEAGDEWSFIVQGILTGDTIYYPSCGSCTTMATVCHSP